ncbi:SET domain-containing protein 5 [Colletotrichum sidae]|uniref:SET domain-containing protein 5 n=1 Tax=Colletotrichum sidae TaxID=1347389 RepID=A0A4R8T9G9_9PEZI|nr:SET domain-containing protein 5 [Colletotrichum sidae]
MKYYKLLATWATIASAQGSAYKAQVPILSSCAATPLFPDYRQACSKSALWYSPYLDGIGANVTNKQPKKDIWRSDEGWFGPHACAGPYCVYSRPSFANGRGIVLVSTAYNAEEASHVDAFTKSSEPGDYGDSTLFRVVEMPGKGLGLVAAKTIERGQRIMAHPPAVVIHRRFIDDIDLENQYRTLDVAVNHLPEATRKTFMEQMGQSGGHKVHDIIHTNSFELGLPIQDGHHFANYPEVSRYNHDCRPNLAFYIDSDLRHYTHAVRDINPGEELTISYVDSLSARHVRQDRAKRNWGFGCSCDQCSLPEPLVRDSDNRLWKMWELEHELTNFESDDFDENSIEVLINLYEQENLDQSYGSEPYRIAAVNYNSLQKEEQAVEHARIALEQLMMEKGPGHIKTKDMKALLQNPKEHWSWAKRS